MTVEETSANELNLSSARRSEIEESNDISTVSLKECLSGAQQKGARREPGS
ncbi:MAG: hypothetical protein LCH46_01475 [Proteobacteria bacterium]|nr:hypothetical protein [Pseudomonadota bacterium]